MNIGMLWFDNDPKAEIATKIERAAAYYNAKYGTTPNLCFVHPSMIHNGSLKGRNDKMSSGEVEVRTTRTILPNHFWIGVNGSPT